MLVFMLAALWGAAGGADRITEISFLRDYLPADGFATGVVGVLRCWGRGEKGSLVRELSAGGLYAKMVDEADFLEGGRGRKKIVYVLDEACSEDVLKKANSSNLFNGLTKWIILATHPQFLDLQKFQKYNILPDSHLVIAQKTIDNHFSLQSIYKISPTANLITKNEGFWDASGPTNFQKTIPSHRLDLTGMTFNIPIVVTNNDTINHLSDYRNGHIEPITKENYILVIHLMELLNATPSFGYVNSWGYKQNNSSWYDGMIGELQAGRAEVGGTALFMTADRLELLEYVSLTTQSRVSFVLRQPSLSYISNVFTLPLTNRVWLCLVALLVLVTILLYVAVKFGDAPQAEDLQSSLLDVSMVTVGGLCQQGTDKEPRNASGKIIMLFSFVALMFVYTSYSANIVALLQATATGIDKLEDLLEYRIDLGAEDIVYNHFYLKAEREPLHRQLYDKKIAPRGQKSHFLPLEEGIRRVRAGFYAFHAEQAVAFKVIGDTFQEHEKCGLVTIDFLPVMIPRMAIRRGTPYKELFRVGFQKLQETGVQSRVHQRLYAKKPECHTGGNNFLSVGIVESYAAFVVLVGGWGLAVVLLLLEKASKKYARLSEGNGGLRWSKYVRR